jgi:tetratricopeptide (TPR) repeat protein
VLIATVGVAFVMLIVLRRIKPAALLVTGLLIGISPVVIRNVVVARQFSLVSSHGGLNFYIGNSEAATGFYRLVPGVRPSIAGQAADTRRVAEKMLGHAVTDAEASDYFFDLGLAWIKAHPADAVALFLKKFAFAFHAQTLPLPHSYPFFAYDEATALRFYIVGPWLLVPLGLVGLIGAAIRTRSRAFIAWVSFVPAYAAAIAIFFIAERYRLPLLVPMAIGSGAALDFAWLKMRERRWTDLALPAAAVIALAIAVNYRFKLDDGRWVEGLRLAERLVIEGRYQEAEQRAQWLETHHRQRPGAGMHGVGAQLVAIGKTDLALPYLQRGYEANPADPHHDYAYGQALFKTGRAAEAIPHLKHGFEAGVEIPGGGLDYALALKETGDAAGFLAALRRVQPAPDTDEEGWLRLGRLAMEAKAPDAAEPFFRRAAEMAPASAAARQQYGLNLLVLERFDAAAVELTAANRLDPRDADTLAHLAFCEVKLNRPDAARAHVADALAIDPNQPLARQLTAVFR